jgi:predicted acylesterase/phospholipase RssA
MSISSTKTVRILSIDGGGVKGVMPLTFLNKFCSDSGIAPKDLASSFDLIVGSSIGGLLSMGLSDGKLPSELLTLMYDNAAGIFYANYSTPPGLDYYKTMVILHPVGLGYNYTFYGVGDAANPTDQTINGLRVAVTNVLGSDTLVSDIPNKFVVTSWNVHEDKATYFSNITQFPDFLIGSTYNAVDVATATASAPLYFPSSTIEGKSYIDGGVFQNNPVLTAYSLGKQIYPTATRFCVLSLGCGIAYNDFIPPARRAFKQQPLSLTKRQYTDRSEILFQLANKLNSLKKENPSQLDFISEIEFKILNTSFQKDLLDSTNDVLPYNVSYLFYLMDNVFIPGNQEASAGLMQFISNDVFDDIFVYRFQYGFLSGQDSSLDNYETTNLNTLVGYANTQYTNDRVNIDNFIQHFIAG